MIFNKSSVFASFSFLPQMSHQNCDPKSTKIHNIKKSMIFGNRVLVLEVSQKQFWRLHATWEAFFVWSPCGVGMRFDTFATPPQRECYFFKLLTHVPGEKLKNHENLILESCCGRVGAKDAKSKSPPKSVLPMVSTIRTLFLTSAKIQWVYEELCIFLKEYT